MSLIHDVFDGSVVGGGERKYTLPPRTRVHAEGEYKYERAAKK